MSKAKEFFEKYAFKNKESLEKYTKEQLIDRLWDLMEVFKGYSCVFEIESYEEFLEFKRVHEIVFDVANKIASEIESIEEIENIN